MYYFFILSFTMFISHPIILLISLVTSFLYSIELGGRDIVKKNLKFMIPTIIITATMNPAFNHEGVTIIRYLNSGNPITLESIIYGISAAILLVTMVIWFYTYNQVMTSDKFIYLFGRVIPSLSLVISMALRFIPQFKNQIRLVTDAQKAIGRDISTGNIFQRMKKAITIFSIMITWSLENAIETADSMRSRGYGLKGRSSFSIYKFEKRDKIALLMIFVLGIYIIIGSLSGGLKWRYFPSMKGRLLDFYSFSLWVSFLILCIFPIIVNRKEEKQWQSTQLEI